MPRALLCFIFLMIVSSFGLAAVPQTIKYVEDVILPNDEIYSYYVVTCSDDRSIDVSAFDDKKLWCVGKGVRENCETKQIKVAKQVCK